jgi:hypothetical protein
MQLNAEIDAMTKRHLDYVMTIKELLEEAPKKPF